jgi:hypothetical protein
MSAEGFPLSVEIPSGLVQPRLLSGVPIAAALGLGCLPIILAVAMGFFYGCLAVMPLIPVWGFLRYWTKKDPGWCDAWLLHVQYAPYYHHR